jgi:hypothetical protein
MPSDEEYQEHYENIVGDSEHYEGFRHIFDEAGIPEQMYDDDQMLEFFDDFLFAFYPEDGLTREEWNERREDWYEETGLYWEDIDWDEWRDIIEDISPPT